MRRSSLSPPLLLAILAVGAQWFVADAFCVEFPNKNNPTHHPTSKACCGPTSLTSLAGIRTACDHNVAEESNIPATNNLGSGARRAKTIMTTVLGVANAVGFVLTTMTAALALEEGGGGDITRGSTLFANNCASCHIGGTNVIKPAKTLQLKDLEKNIKSADQESVQKFFQNSMQHKMLNFPKVEGGKLSEEQVVDVTSYVSDQALGNKW